MLNKKIKQERKRKVGGSRREDESRWGMASHSGECHTIATSHMWLFTFRFSKLSNK